MTRVEAAEYLADMCKECDDFSNGGCLSASKCFEAKTKAIGALYMLDKIFTWRAENEDKK